MRSSKLPTFFLKIVVSAGLIAFFVSKIDLSVLRTAVAEAKVGYLLAGLILYPLGQIVCAVKWQYLARALGIQQDLRAMVRLYFIGMFFNLFLPTSIGGDITRGLYLSPNSGRTRSAFLSVLVERGTGVLTMLVLCSVTMLSPLGTRLPTLLRYGFPALSLAFFLFLWILPRIFRNTRTRVRQLICEDLIIFWRQPEIGGLAIGYSFLFYCIAVAIHVCIARALSLDIPVAYHFITLSLASLSSLLPSFNGIGVRDGAYIYLLTLIGVTSTHALLFSFVWFMIMALSSGIGCVVYLIRGLSPAAAPVADQTNQ